MSTDAHKICFEVIRFLRFKWIQNQEVILNKDLQSGLNL